MPAYPRIPLGCFQGQYAPNMMALDWGATGVGGYVDPYSGMYLHDLLGVTILDNLRRPVVIEEEVVEAPIQAEFAVPRLPRPLPRPRSSNPPSWSEARQKAIGVALQRRAEERSPNPDGCAPGSSAPVVFPTPNNAWTAICVDARGRLTSTVGTSRTIPPQNFQGPFGYLGS